jgi:hypothetical protein
MLEELLTSNGRNVWPMLREQFPTDDHLYGMLAGLWAAGVEEALANVTSGRRPLAGTAARDAAYTLAQRRDPRLRTLLDSQAGRPVVAALETKLAARIAAALGLATEPLATEPLASGPVTTRIAAEALSAGTLAVHDGADLVVPAPRLPAEVLGEVTA